MAQAMGSPVGQEASPGRGVRQWLRPLLDPPRTDFLTPLPGLPRADA